MKDPLDLFDYYSRVSNCKSCRNHFATADFLTRTQREFATPFEVWWANLKRFTMYRQYNIKHLREDYPSFE
jgi:hypothetical protein